MSSVYDKLRRILDLERDQAYRDRAVIGGLARFLAYWAKEARAEAPDSDPAPLTVETVLAALDGYADLDYEARARAVDGLLALLSVTPATPPEEAPANAPAAGPDASVEPETPTMPEPAAAVQPAAAIQPAVSQPPTPQPPSAPDVSLSAPVTELRGVSTVLQKRLERLGVESIRDVLYHLPRRYDDFAQLKTIGRLELGDEVTVVGVVRSVHTHRISARSTIVSVTIGDASGAIEGRWFNQPFVARSFHVGTEVVFSGKVDQYLGRLVFNAPESEPLRRELLHTARLVPVYALTEGLSGRWMRRLTKQTLDRFVPRIVDPLPAAMRAETGLMDLRAALMQMHFPDSAEAAQQARRRLCFDELLLLQLGILRHRQDWRAQRARALHINPAETEAFIARLPFALTGAQQRTIGEILQDLQQPVPMSRLLQGDVGSGKTVVALVTMLAVVRNGLQAALMAPTSVLAEQHYRTLTRLLADEPGVRVALLQGSMPAADKALVKADLAAGRIHIIVGTHALIQSTVDYQRLGLAVVDEQHRFGVAQRGALRAKGAATMPHLLAMTATPIPRTLALTLYGDLDVSVLDELPPGRQPVITAVRDDTARERIYAFLDAQVREGRQVYVICPLVEGSEVVEAKAAVDEFKRLQTRVFPHLKLALLHGRMKAAEKDQVMAAFKEGEYDLLVSTAVIEVGIDVPNTTVILIEGAERFGLAQLHQFRGRVGRGEWKSYCILLSDDPSEQGLERLRALEETTDGFALAEKDLELRGPGDFLGVRQSGLPELKVARLSDMDVLSQARAQAIRLITDDPLLARPQHAALSASVTHFWQNVDLS